MDGLDYWRLCEELDVVQAALLIAGHDPSGEMNSVEGWPPETQPAGYDAAKTAISNALSRELIKGSLVPLYGYDAEVEVARAIPNSVNLTASRVEVESLRSWLASRGFGTGFFFPMATDAPDYLDPNHPRYAPKLAAAVKAWLASCGESATRGKSAKQALVKWLRENAAEFGLSDADGKPNETGIEETAKVANWRPGGGAPKTPSG